MPRPLSPWKRAWPPPPSPGPARLAPAGATAANWVGGVAPSGSAATLDDLVFPPTAVQKSTVNDLPLIGGVASTFNSITISSNSYTLSGNPVTLGKTTAPISGQVTVGSLATGVTIAFDVRLAGPLGDRQFFTVQSGADLTVSGHLSGATGAELAKQGPGLLVLTNDNSAFTGPITVVTNGGILRITNSKALGDTSSGTTVQANAQLQVQGVSGNIPESLTLNGPGPINDGALLNVSGNNTWTGPIALDSDTTLGSNAGTLTITSTVSDLGAGHNLTKEGVGTIVFAHDNTYRGLTSINNGVLVIETPLGLGVGGTAANGTVVNHTTTKTGQLQLLDPTGVGFTILDEQLTLNDAGSNGLGCLSNVQGNNDWAGPITLGSPAPNYFVPGIGAAAGTQLTIDGVISGTNLNKFDAGRVILTNLNTYTGQTIVFGSGALNIRDSEALGTTSVLVNNGAALELEVDSGFDPHGRNLGQDSNSGVSNQLYVTNNITLTGTGIANTGALHSISGINIWFGTIFLNGTAAIGVEPDPNPSNSLLYYTNDYSLRVNNNQNFPSQISGGNLVKVGTGQLILSQADGYTGTTDIKQGWITIENSQALGWLYGCQRPARAGRHGRVRGVPDAEAPEPRASASTSSRT